MVVYLVIACGGAIGSVGRFLLTELVDARWGAGFPVGTLVVNVSGSFLIALCAGLVDNKLAQQFLMIGLLGGFTTFSSFSLQTVQLLQQQRFPLAGLYIALSVLLCVLGTWLGYLLARAIVQGRVA